MFKRLSIFLALGSPLSVLSREVVGAAYMITNNVDENDIIIHRIYEDGRVDFAGITSAGGTGLRVPVALEVADGLGSAQSIFVSGDLLFVVNPGSATVAMFTIDPTDPTQLYMVGEPVDTGGDFPTSVDRNPVTGNLCVMNSGVPDGLQCFTVDPRQGLAPIPNSNRVFDGVSSLPNGKLSQVLFTANGSHVLVQDKGSATVPGHVITYGVNPDGSLSEKGVASTPPSSLAPLQAYSVLPVTGRDNAFIFAQPDTGFGTYEFKDGFDNPATVIKYTIPDQNTTCWVQYSQMTDTYFLTDTEDSKIYEMELDDDLQPTLVKTYYNSSMPIDFQIKGIRNQDFVFVNGAGSLTFDVYELSIPGEAKMIQKYDYTRYTNQLGVAVFFNYVQGMAVYLTD